MTSRMHDSHNKEGRESQTYNHINQEYQSVEKACLAGGNSKMVSETDTCTDVESSQADEVIGLAPHDGVDDGLLTVSSSRRVLSPILEISTRSRLDTAETDQICNFVRSPNITVERTQILNSQYEDDDQRDNDDAFSTVSSLSKDDSLLPRPVLAESVIQGETCPPTEVSITVKGDNSPEWLRIEPILIHPMLRPDQSLSSNVAKPLLLRDQTAPSVLVTDSPRSLPHPPPSSPISLRPTHRRNHTSTSLASSSLDSLSDPATCKLLEGRKRRTMVRVQSANASVGSFVGQSSLITAPTVSSSFTESTTCYRSTAEARRKLASFTGADDVACCTINAEDVYRKRNVVKEELKYMLGLVASPIRLLKKSDSARNVNLQRSGGCLT